MKKQFFAVLLSTCLIACNPSAEVESIRTEILRTEKEFEKMAAEKGLMEAFYSFADENAVIKRGQDSLIKGKENIRNYYEKSGKRKITLTWTPDFIDVSESGDLAYTYGKYVLKTDTSSSEGIFHTVWKRQEDKSWKYVWD